MTPIDPKQSIERVRLVLDEPTVTHPGIDSQVLWRDEMTMIVALIEQTALILRGQRGISNGLKVISEQMTNQNQALLDRIDASLTALAADLATAAAQVVTTLPAPPPSTAITEASSDLTGALVAMENALPFLITKKSPQWLGLVAAVAALQRELRQGRN